MADIRNEVLASSRARSGSREFETAADAQRSAHGRQFDAARQMFDRGDHYGTNVSRIKTMFLGNTDKKESTKPGQRTQDPKPRMGVSATQDSKTGVGTYARTSVSRERSPDAKRKRIPENIPSKTNLDTEMGPKMNIETTNHVQRFNYTRALFAKMEEENRIKAEKERKWQERQRLRSPIRSPVPTSPVRAVSPASRMRSPSLESVTKLRSSSDPSEMEKIVDEHLQIHRPGSIDALDEKESHMKYNGTSTEGGSKLNRYREPQVTKSENDLSRGWGGTSLGSTSRMLWKRQQMENIGGKPPRPSRPNDFEPTRPAYLQNKLENEPDLPPAPSPPKRYLQSQEPPPPPPRPRKDSAEDTNVSPQKCVLREKANKTPERPLSTEEIRASLQEADSYWEKTYGTNDSEPSQGKNSEQKSEVISTKPTEEPVEAQLKPWARYKAQRHSRSSEDDLSKLGEIADTSVHSYRHSLSDSTEVLAKQEDSPIETEKLSPEGEVSPPSDNLSMHIEAPKAPPELTIQVNGSVDEPIIKAEPSPSASSVDSMTPSEQEQLLSIK